MAGSIGEQEIHPVQPWQRPQDLSPEHLHMQVTAQWHTTDSQQKENYLLERLALQNGNDHPGTQWPTTKAMSFLITWLLHRVINLFRKLLGRKLLDSSPLVLAGQIFTGQGAQVIWKSVGPQKSRAAQGDWRWQKKALSMLNPAWPQRSLFLYNSLLFIFWGLNYHSVFLAYEHFNTDIIWQC